MPDEVNKFLAQVDDPRHLIYLVAANARLKIEEGQQILEADDLKQKYHLLISYLSREKEVLALEQRSRATPTRRWRRRSASISCASS